MIQKLPYEMPPYDFLSFAHETLHLPAQDAFPSPLLVLLMGN